MKVVMISSVTPSYSGQIQKAICDALVKSNSWEQAAQIITADLNSHRGGVKYKVFIQPIDHPATGHMILYEDMNTSYIYEGMLFDVTQLE